MKSLLYIWSVDTRVFEQLRRNHVESKDKAAPPFKPANELLQICKASSILDKMPLALPAGPACQAASYLLANGLDPSVKSQGNFSSQPSDPGKIFSPLLGFGRPKHVRTVRSVRTVWFWSTQTILRQFFNPFTSSTPCTQLNTS